MKRIEEIKNWLNYQLEIREAKGYVIGVSGGIDSCVIASILKSASIKHQAYHIIYVLQELSKKDVCIEYLKSELSISLKTINIIDLFDEFTYAFNQVNDPLLSRALNTNIKARLREMVFYNFAKIHNYLVIGTVNKEEFNLGYFVKNSSIGDILPLADIPKEEIRSMAISLNIPHEISQLKASGCIDKQYAEDEWGIKENQMTQILNNKLKNIPKDIISLYINKRELSKHKREFPPIFYIKR